MEPTRKLKINRGLSNALKMYGKTTCLKLWMTITLTTIHIWLNPLPRQSPRKYDSRMICSPLQTQIHNLCHTLLQAPPLIPNKCSHKNGIPRQLRLHPRRNQDSPRIWMMPSDTGWAPKSWKLSSARHANCHSQLRCEHPFGNGASSVPSDSVPYDCN